MKPPVSEEEMINSLLAYLDHGTLIKAAKATYIDKATISTRISSLEKKYGKLITRSKSKYKLPRLTQNGIKFLLFKNYQLDIYNVWMKTEGEDTHE